MLIPAHGNARLAHLLWNRTCQAGVVLQDGPFHLVQCLRPLCSTLTCLRFAYETSYIK